ncbi:MAG: hypothetical protein KDE20_22425, partial [Caldilineaceae bacterium]|nr:hypothetical protein [Caldilineaceae bacterium]
MSMKKTLAAAAIAAMVSTSAHAFYFPAGSGVNAGALAEDDNIDWFVDNDNNGAISVGDRLVAVLEFNQILDVYSANGTAPAQALNTSLDELVAISDVTVTSVVGGRVNFGATAGTSAVKVFSGGSTTNLDLGTFVNCTSMVTCAAAVTDGTPWAEFSFVDADDEWFFTDSAGGAGLFPGLIAGAPAATKFGVVNFSLSLVAGTNNSGYMFED